MEPSSSTDVDQPQLRKPKSLLDEDDASDMAIAPPPANVQPLQQHEQQHHHHQPRHKRDEGEFVHVVPPSGGRSRGSRRQKLSVLAVVVHLCKGNIGPGAMSLPHGFSQAGCYAAPVIFVIVALVSVYNMDLLLHCKRLVSPHAPMSFGDVGYEILGRRGKILIDTFLVGTQLGICCVYFTFVATNIHAILPDNLQEAVHERQLILLIFPLILMLSWVRTLHRITPFSSLANAAVISGIAIVFYYSLSYMANPTKPLVEPVKVDWTQFPEFYGTAVYSFEGIGLILPIQNDMREPHLFPRVLALCMLLILVLFLFIGEVPTLAFGQITNGSMTAVLHEYYDGWLGTAANVFLAFACLLSFPIQLYPALEVMEKTLQRHRSSLRPIPRPKRPGRGGQAHERAMLVQRSYLPETDESHAVLEFSSSSANGPASSSLPQQPPSSLFERLAASVVGSLSQYECNRTLFRSMLCTCLMVIAICVPDVGLLISLFGAVGSSMLAIIIPPYMYLRATKDSISCVSRVAHWGIVIFGVVGMIAGTVQAMLQIIASL